MEEDRRRFPRKEMNLAVFFSTADSDEGAKGMGVTANVSEGGIFFHPRHWRHWEPLEEGQKLNMRVDGIRYDGTVVRLEGAKQQEHSKKPGLAVRFDGRPEFENRRLAI